MNCCEGGAQDDPASHQHTVRISKKAPKRAAKKAPKRAPARR